VLRADARSGGSVRVEGEPLRIGAPFFGEVISYRQRLSDLQIRMPYVIDSPIHLETAAQAEELTYVPAEEVVESRHDLVAGELLRTSGYEHLHNERCFRQIRLLLRQTELDAQIQIVRTPGTVGEPLRFGPLVEVVPADAAFEPVGANAETQ